MSASSPLAEDAPAAPSATTDASECAPDGRVVADVSIAELDGLRAIACLTVLLGHFDAVTSRVSFSGAWTELVTILNPSMGVLCFFTLSGFLLTYLAVLEHRQTGEFDVRAFYTRRVFRIWPLHFVVVATVMLLVSPFGPLPIDERSFRWCVENLWPYLLFVNNWSMGFRGVGGHQDFSPPMLNISWSIAIEEQVYLLFPLVMLAVLGASRRRLIVVSGAVVGLATAYRLYALLTWGPEQGGRLGVIYLATPSYFDVVLAGGIAGWICASRRLAGAQPMARRSSRWLGVAVLVGLVGVSLAWRYVYTVGSTYLDVVVYPLMGAVFGAGMFWVATNPSSLLTGVLRWRPLRVLGTLSFGLYLWHFTARTIAYELVEGFRPRGQGQVDVLVVATFVAYLALTLFLATLSYALVERRFLLLRRRFSTSAPGRRRSPAGRREAPGPRALPLMAACLTIAAISIGLAHLLVRR